MAGAVLVIQTAFLGDAVLASAVLESLHATAPERPIDLLVRKGNEGLYADHPFLRNLLVWNKKDGKYKTLRALRNQIKAQRYEAVLNLHRFASSGYLTAFSGAKIKAGYRKNPLSFLFTHRFEHPIGDGTHEIERNHQLLSALGTFSLEGPRLYPRFKDRKQVEPYGGLPYFCLAPTSVWFTKQYPAERWVALIDKLPSNRSVYLLGGPGDKETCEQIRLASAHPKVKNLAGELGLLASAALMEGAQMNYVNDSGPLHFCSAMKAPVTAVFCSTVPRFGFGPWGEKGVVIETKENLDCRPCGLHGHRACPKGHFRCATTIDTLALVARANPEKA